MKSQQLDSEKIRKLLNSATNSRQRKMYQSLLDKALAQEKTSAEANATESPSSSPSSSKKTETSGKKSALSQKKKNKKKDAVSASNKEANSEKASETQPVSVTPEKPVQEEEIFYQAIGTLIATPYIKDDLMKVKIDEKEYDLLYVPGTLKKVYKALKHKLPENESSVFKLKVYPKSGLSSSNNEPKLSVSLARFQLHDSDNNDNEFIIKGIWQYIPDSEYKLPVISVYRNQTQLVFFNKLKKEKQIAFCQPNHIPVVWDAPVEPFKASEEVDNTKEMPKYFVQVRAKLKDGLYVVEEMLHEPTLDIPPFIQMPREDETSLSDGS